jgi:hypothetical protein
MDAVALKLSKFGGLSALRRARDLCLHLGAKDVHRMHLGLDIATAAALHLGAATPPPGAQRLRPVGLCRRRASPRGTGAPRRPHRAARRPGPWHRPTKPCSASPLPDRLD